MKFLKIGTNGGTDPCVNWVGAERIVLDVITGETELPNDVWPTESEHSVDEKGEEHEPLDVFVVWAMVAVLVVPFVTEIKDFEILPKVSPSARDEAHGTDWGFSREEGEDVTQYGVW
jgi:hypothetical protein